MFLNTPARRDIKGLYLHKGKDHGGLTGLDLLLGLTQSGSQCLPFLLEQGNYKTHPMLVIHRSTTASVLTLMSVYITI